MPDRMRSPGNSVTAPLDAGQVPVDVDREHALAGADLRTHRRVVVLAPLGEVDVLGERDGGQTRSRRRGGRCSPSRRLRRCPRRTPSARGCRREDVTQPTVAWSAGAGYERVMAPNRIRRTVVAVLLTASVGDGLRRRPPRHPPAPPRRRRSPTQPVAPFPGTRSPIRGDGRLGRGGAAGSRAGPAAGLPQVDQRLPVGPRPPHRGGVVHRRRRAAAHGPRTSSHARSPPAPDRCRRSWTPLRRTPSSSPSPSAATTSTCPRSPEVSCGRPWTCRRVRRTSSSTASTPSHGPSRRTPTTGPPSSPPIRDQGARARVILVGYGTYVRPEGCFPAQPINPVDAAYFQAKIDELDEPPCSGWPPSQGVEFFDTGPLSVGHDICAAPAGPLRRGLRASQPGGAAASQRRRAPLRSGPPSRTTSPVAGG